MKKKKAPAARRMSDDDGGSVNSGRKSVNQRNNQFYGSRSIKCRYRKTKAEIKAFEDSLYAIVEKIAPASVRQTFYRAEVAGLVPKEEAKGYRVVQRRLGEMRKSGRMPYGWITDSLRTVQGYTRYGGIQEFAREVSSLYRRDYWREAKHHVEIWIEKDALASTISPVVIHEMGLDLHVARGFSSLSYLHGAAEDLIRDGRPAFVYVLTDLDPSGISIARDISAKLIALVADKVPVTVKRIAVEPWQVQDWELPTRPTKTTDSRAAKFLTEFGSESVELDAIDPNVLRQLVRDHIMRHADMDAMQRLRMVEEAERETIAKIGFPG